MRFAVGVLLLGVALGGFNSVRAGQTQGDPARVRALSGVSSRIYETTRQIESVHAGRARAPSDLDARIATIEKTLQALRRDADRSGDAISSRKARQLSALAYNMERAGRMPQTSALPELIPSPLAPARRSSFAPIDARHGGSCGTALGLGANMELDGYLREGGEVWLRVETDRMPLRVSTAATPLDTDIAMFDACPLTAAVTAEVENDDAFGLAATILIDARAKGPRWLRVRNLGASGAVSIIAGDAGSIGGRVTDAVSGDALVGTTAIAFSTDGWIVNAGYGDENGDYTIALDAGSYYVTAFAGAHVSEAWPNAECMNSSDLSTCAPGQAQTIAVAAGAETSGIDFALGTGARIDGIVHDAASGTVLDNVQLALVDQRSQTVQYMWSDLVGRYSFTTLPAGIYYVEAIAANYRAQVFEGIDCPSWGVDFCDPTGATPVPLDIGGAARGIDFDMHHALHVDVTVNLEPGDFDYPFVTVYGSAGNFVTGTSIPSGTATAVGPLAPGNYYIVATHWRYLPQLYDHVQCVSDCSDELASGTPVHVADGAPAPSATFDLHPLRTVSGRVADAGTGAGLADVSVQMWPTDGSGFPVFGASTGADGSYAVTSVQPGSYWIVTRSSDHHDEMYPHATCGDGNNWNILDCDLGAAVPVVVGDAADVTGIDFALALNATVSGTVRYRGPVDSFLPVANVYVTLADPSGAYERTVFTQYDGSFSISDVVAGTYFAMAQGPSIFGEIYSGIDCPANVSCDPTLGTPIAVAQGQGVGGIDFDAIGQRVVVGRATDALSGAGVPGIVLDSWDENGVYCNSAATDERGDYAIADNYCASSLRKLSTYAGPRYSDQVYDGIACPLGPAYLGLCPLDAASEIDLPQTPQVTRADFVLDRVDPVFANGFD